MGEAIQDYEQFQKSHWTDLERRNLRVIVDFVEGIKAKRFDEVIARYADSPYVQHNRSVSSGIRAIVNTNRALAKRFPQFTLTAKYIYLDGDMVTFHSHVTFSAKHRGDDRKGLNVVDIWRVSEGRILEHWDAIQPLDVMSRFFFLLTGGAVRNNNGVF